MSDSNLHKRIRESGLRLTPQRIIVLEVLDQCSHPTADHILQKVRLAHPNISTGTIYKILEVFEEKGIINKVVSSGDIMRYDSVLKNHHHLHNSDSSKIEDYYDDELFGLIENYLSEKEIPGFQVSDIKIQLTGKFTNEE